MNLNRFAIFCSRFNRAFVTLVIFDGFRHIRWEFPPNHLFPGMAKFLKML